MVASVGIGGGGLMMIIFAEKALMMVMMIVCGNGFFPASILYSVFEILIVAFFVRAR